jgi:hypothetical protein
MIGKRTKIDFSEHEVLVTKTNEVLIHYLKKPNTVCDSIKYINCGGILAVTGDYGNWIFCREFHPSEDGYVSDCYWHEKLISSSTQEATEFDKDATKEAILEKVNEYKEENSDNLEDEKVQERIEYYEECMNRCYEHELDYTHFAYREQPNGMDYDDVILVKDYKFRLKIIFDGFDEICRRLKEAV